MADNYSEDRGLGGGEGPGERQPRQMPAYVWPLVAAVVGGMFVLVNGWFAYIASTSRELVETRHQTLAAELRTVIQRLDRLDDRLTHLEQIRMSGGNGVAAELQEPKVAQVAGGERLPDSAPDPHQ